MTTNKHGNKSAWEEIKLSVLIRVPDEKVRVTRNKSDAFCFTILSNAKSLGAQREPQANHTVEKSVTE